MENYSPQTPGKSRRSYCPSEYESAGEGDDISDNSLYYSIIDDGNMSMNMSMNKENATNGIRRSVADLNASACYRGSRIATPLLRKVLIDPSNKTPRNKNNKRVSFSQSPKVNPMPELSSKIAKMQLKESNEMVQSSINASAERKRVPLTPGKALKNRSLDQISETIGNGTSSDAALTVDNVSKHSREQYRTDASVQDTKTKMENDDSPFTLNTTAGTDDIEKDQMHNTIIENVNQDGDQTLTTLNIAAIIPEEPIAMDIVSNEKKSIDVQSKGVINKDQSPIVESTVPEPIVEPKSVVKVNLAESVTVAMSSGKKDRKKSLIHSWVAPPNTPNKSTAVSAADILNKVNSAVGTVGTKNAAKLNRAQLASETRKSVLPVDKKPSRQTVYKRRSGTFETRKVVHRATMARMSMVKSVVSRKSVMPSTSKTVVDKPVATKPIAPKPAQTKKKLANSTNQTSKQSTTFQPTAQVDSSLASSASREPLIKPRMSTRFTTARLSIYTSRQPPTATMNARSQAKNINNSITSSTTTSMASTSGSSSEPKKEVFVKPTLPQLLLLNKKPKAVDSKLPIANSSFKCKYCDRTFAKNFGLDQHLADNCEKIPASQRRLVLKDQTDKAESKTRKHESDKHFQSQRQNDAWKHSRFFVEKFNQAVSAPHIATKTMESGLSNLRNELKVLSNAHSGVKRTPKKAIKCLSCNKLFWDCVEYAIHKSNHVAEEQQQQQQQQQQQELQHLQTQC